MSKNPPCSKPFDEGGSGEDAEVFARAVSSLVDVDAEKRAKLCLYRDLLLRWNFRMNLMSDGDVRRFWSRHCWESVQLLPFLPSEGFSVCDLGSGAGFPGFVLALLSEGNRFTLIESRQKKASFLRHVSRETCTPVKVETARVEDKPHTTDLVVSRAFASLEKTLKQLEDWKIGRKNYAYRALLLKGSRWQRELTEARQSWTIQACVERLKQKNDLAPEQQSEKHSRVVLKLKEWSRDRKNF